MSRLSLTERLAKPIRQPKEIACWSLVEDKIEHNARALNYYYFPEAEINRKLDLLTGFSQWNSNKAVKNHQYLDPLLDAVQHYEHTNGRLEVDVITWRGLLTRVLSLAVSNAEDGFEFLVTNFDGQVFMAEDPKTKAEFDFPGKDKFVYSGYNFEKFATLPKPWGEATREEIEGRYKGTVELNSEYGILIKSGIGSIKVAYGAEVDCVEQEKDPKNPLAHYVEIKTTRSIKNRGHARTFEKKLFKSWLQSFLAGVPKIVYGFREDDFRVSAVEEYKTTQLPSMVKKSAVSRSEDHWNGNDAIGFYAVFLAWVRDTVKPGESYRLKWQKGGSFIELQKTTIDVGRTTAFLKDSFVEWRNHK